MLTAVWRDMGGFLAMEACGPFDVDRPHRRVRSRSRNLWPFPIRVAKGLALPGTLGYRKTPPPAQTEFLE